MTIENIYCSIIVCSCMPQSNATMPIMSIVAMWSSRHGHCTRYLASSRFFLHLSLTICSRLGQQLNLTRDFMCNFIVFVVLFYSEYFIYCIVFKKGTCVCYLLYVRVFSDMKPMWNITNL